MYPLASSSTTTVFPRPRSLHRNSKIWSSRIDCDTATKSILLSSAGRSSRFVTLRLRRRPAGFRRNIRHYLTMYQQSNSPLAHAFRGLSRFSSAITSRAEESAIGIRASACASRPAPCPLTILSGAIAAWSCLDAAKDLVDDMRDALRRAESFGDISGIIAAQWAYGTVLLRAEKGPTDEAIAYARTRSDQHPQAPIWTARAGHHWSRFGRSTPPEWATRQSNR